MFGAKIESEILAQKSEIAKLKQQKNIFTKI